MQDSNSVQCTPGFQHVHEWMDAADMQPFAYQLAAWQAIHEGYSGIVNAPTGYGKTFSLFLGSVIQYVNEVGFVPKKRPGGPLLIWVTPLRALAKDIARAMEAVLDPLKIPWKVAVRNGDTPTNERQKIRTQRPEVLVTTPESIHLMLSQQGYSEWFANVRWLVVDEWHELLGSKRGVLTELAISRFIGLTKTNTNRQFHHIPLQVWGLSATIGNIDQALDVLLAALGDHQKKTMIRAQLRKNLQIQSIFPDDVDSYPWAGHLGLRLAHKLLPILRQHNTTLVFINTRGMSEIWYQTLLQLAPDLAGALALHHGSIEQEIRIWVEEALHDNKLKAVICTASLDLGVDFRPVDAIIQVGSPKGVARFLQRAGRSGHAPGAVSLAWFLPTNTLELLEVSALRAAIDDDVVESKEPLLLCYDVLIQYLCTLAVGEGFLPDEIVKEVRSTFCFQDMPDDEWHDALLLITQGGSALHQYDEFQKVIKCGDGRYQIRNRKMAMRHRLSIGAIVSDAMLKVKLLSGGYIGHIEEGFISRFDPGTVFTLAGRNLELIGIKEMTVLVRKSEAKKSIVPSWMGGRMSLSANLGHYLRLAFVRAVQTPASAEEHALRDLLHLQATQSHVPDANELLIEYIHSEQGYHLLAYPFEGRQVHEAMSAVVSWRIGQQLPITFSIAMNDYGFELLSDQPFTVTESTLKTWFHTDRLIADYQRSVNSTEMARRHFREIAVIGGLLFQGLPGEQVKARHLQNSAGLLFNVLSDFEPNNLLLQQSFREVMQKQMEGERLYQAFERIQQAKIVLTHPKQFTPLSFPIVVDGLNRNAMSTEKLSDKIERMRLELLQDQLITNPELPKAKRSKRRNSKK